MFRACRAGIFFRNGLIGCYLVWIYALSCEQEGNTVNKNTFLSKTLHSVLNCVSDNYSKLVWHFLKHKYSYNIYIYDNNNNLFIKYTKYDEETNDVQASGI
jgi:hypothetical protein